MENESLNSSLVEPEIPTTIEPGTTGSDSESVGLAEKIERAGNAALAKHVSERSQPKRKRGRPRKKPVPVGHLVNDAGSPLLAENQAADLSNDGQDSSENDFEEADAEALVDGILEMLNDVAEGWLRTQAVKALNDKALAEECGKRARMSDGIRNQCKRGGVAYARKLAVDLSYAPETMGCIALGFWAFSLYSQKRQLTDAGKEYAGGFVPPKTE